MYIPAKRKNRATSVTRSGEQKTIKLKNHKKPTCRDRPCSLLNVSKGEDFIAICIFQVKVGQTIMRSSEFGNVSE